MMDTAEAAAGAAGATEGGRMPATEWMPQVGPLRCVCENLLTRFSARLDQMRFLVYINLSVRATQRAA